MTTRNAAKEKLPPSWVTDGTQMIACIDGPLRDQWFFLSEWQERVAASKRMLALGQRRSPCLDYAPDGTEQHPEWPMVSGAAMHYRPREDRP